MRLPGGALQLANRKTALGIFAWFGYSLSFRERLALIKQAGFGTTCLWFGDEEEMVRDGRADEMPDLVRDLGLTIDNIHAPFWDHHRMWSESREHVNSVRQELSSALAFCGRHHIPAMVVHLGGAEPLPPNQTGLDAWRELIRQAEDLGVTIAAENGEGGPDYVGFVLSNIQSSNLGLCYDASHDMISGQPLGEVLRRWGHRLVTTHLSDNRGANDDHLLPGTGAIDWATVRESFPQSSYEGALVLEPDGPEAGEGLTPREFLRAGYQWLVRFENRLER